MAAAVLYLSMPARSPRLCRSAQRGFLKKIVCFLNVSKNRVRQPNLARGVLGITLKPRWVKNSLRIGMGQVASIVPVRVGSVW